MRALAWLLSASALGLAACGEGKREESSTAARGDRLAGARQAETLRPGETLGARVVRTTALRAEPGGRVLGRVGPRTRFGSRTVLAVVGGTGGWFRVLSEKLPNGRSAWISNRDATLLREPWTIDVSLARRELVLRHRGRVRLRARVAVGAPGTPTPTGTYGVTDRLRTGGGGSPYGCCVLALSGRQPDVPQGWRGGDRLAIHGTSAPASIGRAASLGCLRVGDRELRELMRRVPLGARVRIRA